MIKQTIIFLAIVLFFVAKSFGQTIEPFRIAITVQNLEKSSAWYSDIFDMDLYKEMSFPEYDSLKINFLRSSSFELELLEKANSFTIKKYVPDYNINVEPLIGFAKISFKVNNVNQLYNQLKSKNVAMVYDLTEDKTFNSRYFIIEDLDGNLLQFIELLDN